MTSDVRTGSTSWIAVSIAGLVLRALQANRPRPLGENVRRMTRHPDSR